MSSQFKIDKGEGVLKPFFSKLPNVHYYFEDAHVKFTILKVNGIIVNSPFSL